MLQHLCVPCSSFGSNRDVCASYFANTMTAAKTIKRNTKKTNQQVRKRPAACMVIEDQPEEMVTIEGNQTDRNKKNFLLQNKHRMPEGVSAMIDALASHQRGKVINNLVRVDPRGGYKFNFQHPIVEDSLCAIVLYPPYTV